MNEERPFVIKDLFSRRLRPSLLSAFAFLAAAYIVEHYANLYAIDLASRPTSHHVGDLLLDNLPVINLNFMIIEGALLAIALGMIFVLLRPRYILFCIKTIALFIMTRAIFTSLTHVGIYPQHIAPGLGFFDGVYLYLNLQTGFFFSGHTGLPFLMGLIFWEERRARIAFLLLSALGAAAVLFAHVHYSIDVFAAPFMAFGIFEMSKRFFASDYKLAMDTHTKGSA
jgi:hypothetical protein